jgi:hypothetical protein
VRYLPIVWPASAVGWSTAAGLAVFLSATPSVRAPIIVAFLLVCPGLALTRLLRLGDLAVELTLAVALSIALDGLVAGSLLYAGEWSPRIGFTVLLAVAVVAAAIDAARTRRVWVLDR